MCSSTPSTLTASELSSKECFDVGERDSVVRFRRKCRDTLNPQKIIRAREGDGELSMYERTREPQESRYDDYDERTTVRRPEPVYLVFKQGV